MRTMLGLAAQKQPVLITRAVSVVRQCDPFRGAPVGESVAARRAQVLGIKTAFKLKLVPDMREQNDARNAQLEVLRRSQREAYERGDFAESARLLRRIGDEL